MAGIQRAGEHASIYVQNKLSKKPQKSINKVTNFVEQKLLSKGTWHDLNVRQDYANNAIVLDLTLNSTGEVVQTKKLPITSSSKRYTAAVREMKQTEYDNVMQQYEKDYQKEYNSFGNRAMRAVSSFFEFLEK